MFENIGGKIKTLVKLVCAIGIIASLLIGYYLMAESGILLGILVMGLGILISWIGSFIAYGYGEIIEQLCIMNINITKLCVTMKKIELNCLQDSQKS